ncbi:hypothetical protein PS2_030273 [Malus domestica]
MAAMLANTSNTTYETGGSSNSRPYSGNFDLGSHTSSFSPMAPFQQLPFPSPTGPVAFVSQTGSGTYNNFRGNNYRNKGKGKRFNTGFQQPSGYQTLLNPPFSHSLSFRILVLQWLQDNFFNHCLFVKYVIKRAMLL